MKPKGHFLQHYPAMIRTFGPVVKTLWFESKNTYFKSTFQSNKDRKNVCYSMAERHQMLMYIHYVKSSLLEVTLEVLEPLFIKLLRMHLNLRKERFFASQKQSSEKATDMGQVNVSYFQVKTTNLYLDMYLPFFITKERIIYFVI